MNMGNTKLILSNLMMNKMKVDGNMLHSGMKDGISTKIGGPHIVALDGRSGKKVDMKFSGEILNPI